MRILLTVCAFGFLMVASFAYAADEDNSQIQRILDGTIDPSTLPAEMRSQSIQKLHVLAESGERNVRRQATTALLNLNDTQTVHQVLQELDSSSPRERKAASQLLTQGCRNPEILPVLEELLFINEKPGMELVQGEFLLPRRSTVAADTIRQIIASSSAFSPTTRDWARNLAGGNPESLRKTMRVWWRSNAPHIQTRAYDRVAPVPRTATTNNTKSADGEDWRQGN